MVGCRMIYPGSSGKLVGCSRASSVFLVAGWLLLVRLIRGSVAVQDSPGELVAGRLLVVRPGGGGFDFSRVPGCKPGVWCPNLGGKSNNCCE